VRSLRLEETVLALCSERCAGRAAGTPEGEQARQVVVEGFGAAGVTPVLQAVPGCRGANVIARLGDGPRVILVGAHFDHLGRTRTSAYWGADDNAAAVAVLVELARSLRPPPGFSYLLVGFDGEEPPYFLTPAMGSMEMTARPPVPLASIELMIALDLVGHALGPSGTPAAVQEALFVLGAEKSAGTGSLVEHALDGVEGVCPAQVGADIIPPLSDYEAFRRERVPFLFLTCGRWRHYHEVTDTPDRLDYRKLAGVTEAVERIVGAASQRPSRPAFDDKARDHLTTARSLARIARQLEPVEPRAGMAAGILEDIAKRSAGGKVELADWSTMLQIVALLEQGLA
jgi:hypothetical protein